jgi:hypothetical protein
MDEVGAWRVRVDLRLEKQVENHIADCFRGNPRSERCRHEAVTCPVAKKDLMNEVLTQLAWNQHQQRSVVDDSNGRPLTGQVNEQVDEIDTRDEK